MKEAAQVGIDSNYASNAQAKLANEMLKIEVESAKSRIKDMIRELLVIDEVLNKIKV